MLKWKTHLGYTKYQRNDNENARNGTNTKDVVTDNGLVEIDVPRDRGSSFAPILLPKRQNRINGLDEKILSLYAKGMSLSDIKIQPTRQERAPAMKSRSPQ
jgi:putative transposase